jgi:hypothetical protein
MPVPEDRTPAFFCTEVESRQVLFPPNLLFTIFQHDAVPGAGCAG